MSQDKQTDPIILIKPQPTVMGSNCWEEDFFFFFGYIKAPHNWGLNLQPLPWKRSGSAIGLQGLLANDTSSLP